MIQCSNECRFCSILNGNKKFGEIDTPIYEDDNYFLLSSVGALVEGWTLVIPKKHGYSMKKYYSNKTFIDFLNKSIYRIKNAYKTKKIVVFEHGANKYGSLTACGTNHAHLHIVPLDESILDDIKLLLEFKEIKVEHISDCVGDNEYLLYADIENEFDDSSCYIHILKKPESQFFRKVIANKLGIPEKYNYRENMNLDISKSTLIMLKKRCDNG